MAQYNKLTSGDARDDKILKILNENIDKKYQ